MEKLDRETDHEWWAKIVYAGGCGTSFYNPTYTNLCNCIMEQHYLKVRDNVVYLSLNT